MVKIQEMIKLLIPASYIRICSGFSVDKNIPLETLLPDTSGSLINKYLNIPNNTNGIESSIHGEEAPLSEGPTAHKL